MADCDVCGSPLSAGAGGGAGSWQSHVSDFNDPHRTMELVARELPALSVGSAPPSSTDGAKARDWFVDLAAGTLWVCLPAQGGGLEWTAVADRSPTAQDLSGYATRAMLADYATVASLSGYLRPSDLSGYNFITQSALATALSPLASKTYVATAISAGGFLTQAAADAEARYAPAATGWPLFAVHLLGTGVAIAFAEEFFWRAYLLRAVRTPDFLDIPVGAFHAPSFLAVAAVFAAEHGSLAVPGLLAGLAYGLLFIRTRDVWAACLAHATTNLALGAYVLSTGHWEFW